jgi:microfibrillar-associated protein 1
VLTKPVYIPKSIRPEVTGIQNQAELLEEEQRMLSKIQEEVQEYNNHKLVMAIQQDFIKPKAAND